MPENSNFKFNLERDPAAGLPPEGIHRFVVETSEPKEGGDKGPYLNLRLGLYESGVRFQQGVFDKLFQTKESRWKVDQFFNCVGAPEKGEAGPTWFVGKSGYARFVQVLDQNGTMQVNVKRYLNEAETEKAIEKLTRIDDDSEVVPTQRGRQAVSEPVRKTSSRKSQIEELVGDEASPF